MQNKQLNLHNGKAISTSEMFLLNTRFGKLISLDEELEDEDIILIATMSDQLYCWNYYAYRVLFVDKTHAQIEELNSETLVIYDDSLSKMQQGKSALEILQTEHANQLSLLEGFDEQVLSSLLRPDILDLIQAKYAIDGLECISVVSNFNIQEIDLKKETSIYVRLGTVFIIKAGKKQQIWYVNELDTLNSKIKFKIFDVFDNFELSQKLTTQQRLSIEMI